MLAIEQDPAEFDTPNGVPGCFVWDIAQLAPGQLDVERNFAPLDGALIGSVTVNRTALHQVHTDAGWGVVVLPAPESDAVYFEGRRLLAGDSVLLPPDSHLELLTHAVGRVYLVAFRGGCVGSRARLRRPRWYANGEGRAASGFPADLGTLLARWNSAGGDSFSNTALQARILAWLRSTTAEADPADAEVPSLPRRRMAVERVRRFIHAHLAESMTLAELCRHAHLQARSLEYGFRDLVGLSPFKYIKMLRLGEVRRRLQTTCAAERSVSEVALDCGFCHLSQFAADYKRVFLESPSATRRAIGRARTARVARYETDPAVFAAR
ncbi:MAG TPA: AraC family transcriptional regulator [Steroidobacteraceae bacterium]|nr:AraC family transcriptional regulator [Steroidobacteraceae bacterium]